MKKVFELPDLKLESLQPSEAIMDAEVNEEWTIDYFSSLTTDM